MVKKDLNLNLPPRLALITSKVDINSKVADIGTDHGYIPIYLIKNGISNHVIASDINEGPLNKALLNIKKHGADNFVKTVLSDGLEKINTEEIDTIIIAGMGGVLICDILSEAKSKIRKIKKLILQPMTAHEELRKWLNNNDFLIVDEELALEQKKIYNVIAAKPGKEIIEDNIYYYIGKKLLEKKDPVLPYLLNQKIEEHKKIIKNLQSEKSPKALMKLKECEKMLEKYRELKRMII